jgi:acetyl esterase/lipase
MAAKETLVKLLGPFGRWLARRRLRAVMGIDVRRIRIERNVVFGRGGEVELTLDLAMPREGAGSFPAVVLLPAGGWQQWARPLMHEGILEGLATRGYVTAEVWHRLAPAAKFPSQVEDCKAAVRWLRANAQRYHIDPDRIAALGASSGGHLACMLGLTGPADGFEGNGGQPAQSSRVQAVVDLFGIADLTDFPWRDQKQKGLLLPFMGMTYAEDPDLYRKASPVEHVHAGAPPFLIIHGDADPAVPVEQSRRLAEKLKAAGVSAELIVVPGAGHAWGPPLLLETIEQVVGFLDARLKAGLPSTG